MKTTTASLALLLGLAACGPAAGEDDATATAESEGTGDTPLLCYVGMDTYEEGDVFETEDGCVTYRCESGATIAIEDARTSVDGDLELSTQETVDAQQCLGTVGGRLRITGTAADLTPLAQLTRVGGALEIDGAAVVSLHGLEQLIEVDAGIVIARNAGLTTLSFHRLLAVLGDLAIEDNDALVSLAGAEFLGGCGGCTLAGPREPSAAEGPGGDEGSALTAGDEPSPGGTFYGNILIADNDVLVDLTALGTLYSAWADVRFRNNAALASLAALGLASVMGDLEITHHVALSDADAQAFAAGVAVVGVTTLCGNLGGQPCP